MLLVKGKNGKSVILELIDKNTQSLTFVYYNQALIEDSLWINSDTMKFQDFMFELSQYIKSLDNNTCYEYLIIYTNMGEPTIKNQKELLQKLENTYGFQVIVGCQ